MVAVHIKWSSQQNERVAAFIEEPQKKHCNNHLVKSAFFYK